MLSRYSDITIKSFPVHKVSASLTPKEIKKKEAQTILKNMGKGLYIALVDSGKKFDSIQFSKQLEKYISKSNNHITFIIGGAYGLDQAILDKADVLLSLSSLTFSHQLVRLVLLEQLFRAFSIIHNTDYHK